MDEELADIDRQISQLSSQTEKNESKSRGPFWCQLIGAIILLGAAPLVLPFKNDHSWALSLNADLICLYLGLPLFLYGWMWSRRNIYGLREKTQLYELARLLKLAELDKRLVVTTELSRGALIFHIHDKQDGPEQRCWVKRLGVLYNIFIGLLQFSHDTEPGYRWRSKHTSENEISPQVRQEESKDIDQTSGEREYRLHTLQISRSALDAGYAIHPCHFIPAGEEIEGWKFISVCPFEKKSDQQQVTILALIERTLEIR